MEECGKKREMGMGRKSMGQDDKEGVNRGGAEYIRQMRWSGMVKDVGNSMEEMKGSGKKTLGSLPGVSTITCFWGAAKHRARHQRDWRRQQPISSKALVDSQR